MNNFTIPHLGVGSNQYQAKPKGLHLFGQRRGNGRELAYYILGVVFVLTIGITNKAIVSHRARLDHMMLVTQAHAQVRNWTQPEMAPVPEQQRVKTLIHRYFGDDADMAIKVFSCESGLRANAENDHNSDGLPDAGIAQIHVYPSDPFTADEMKNPVANLMEAKHKFDTRGWQPWASSEKCWKGGE